MVIPASACPGAHLQGSPLTGKIPRSLYDDTLLPFLLQQLLMAKFGCSTLLGLPPQEEVVQLRQNAALQKSHLPQLLYRLGFEAEEEVAKDPNSTLIND